MKYVLMTFALMSLLTGCQYEAPLVEKQSIPINSELLGLWEPVPDEDGVSEDEGRMMILKISETEYMIHHPTGDQGIYYHAYPIAIADIHCVQIRIMGTHDRPIKKDEMETYHVARYEFSGDTLLVSLLNSKVVSNTLKTTAELKQAFTENKSHKELFDDPVPFRKVMIRK